MGQLLEQSTRCSLQSSLRILTVSECHPFSRWSMLRPPVVGFWRHTLYPQGSRRYNSVPCSHRSGRHLPPRTLATPESKIWVVSSWHNMPGSQPSKLMWPAKTSGMQRKEEKEVERGIHFALKQASNQKLLPVQQLSQTATTTKRDPE